MREFSRRLPSCPSIRLLILFLPACYRPCLLEVTAVCRKHIYLMLVLCFLCIQTPGVSWGMNPSMEDDVSKESVLDDVAPDVAPNDEGILQNFKKRLRQIWQSDSYDLYLPAYTWHNRLTYDKSHIRRYNEYPWGGGFGKSYKDEDGDRHYLFIMGFQDSHDMFQPYGGYAFMKNWGFGEKEDFTLGAGFVLGITARQDYGYAPLPLPLPIIGVQYKCVAVEATYIPGTKNNGNVLFTWIRYNLE